jgi:hypothetical protein
MRDRERLIQEDYRDTPDGAWKVLVVCQMLNIAAWMTAERVVAQIFLDYPSPFVLHTEVNERPTETVLRVMDDVRPLGLKDRRTARLLAMTAQYVASAQLFGPEYHRYQIGGFAGCGQYAVDAWQLFILREPCHPTDKQLMRFAKREGLYDDNKR